MEGPRDNPECVPILSLRLYPQGPETQAQYILIKCQYGRLFIGSIEPPNWSPNQRRIDLTYFLYDIIVL